MGNKKTREAVDDVLARNPQFDRKNAQLCRAIARSLQRTLDVDVDDPVLDGVSVVDVRIGDHGAFVCVCASSSLNTINEQQRRLEHAVPLFRTALAHELARKRVPVIRFVVVPDVVVAGADDVVTT